MSVSVAKSVPKCIVDWNEKHIKLSAMAFFNKVDVDNSNSIDAQEMVSVIKELNALKAQFQLAPLEDVEETAATLLEENDTDEDGTLSFEEFEPLFTEVVDKIKKSTQLSHAYDAIVACALSISPEITPDVFESAVEKYLSLVTADLKKAQLDEDTLTARLDSYQEVADAIASVYEGLYDEDNVLTKENLAEFKDAVNEEVDVEVPEPLPAAASQKVHAAGPPAKKAGKPAKAAPKKEATEESDDEDADYDVDDAVELAGDFGFDMGDFE